MFCFAKCNLNNEMFGLFVKCNQSEVQLIMSLGVTHTALHYLYLLVYKFHYSLKVVFFLIFFTDFIVFYNFQ